MKAFAVTMVRQFAALSCITLALSGCSGGGGGGGGGSSVPAGGENTVTVGGIASYTRLDVTLETIPRTTHSPRRGSS